MSKEAGGFEKFVSKSKTREKWRNLQINKNLIGIRKKKKLTRKIVIILSKQAGIIEQGRKKHPHGEKILKTNLFLLIN